MVKNWIGYIKNSACCVPSTRGGDALRRGQYKHGTEHPVASTGIQIIKKSSPCLPFPELHSDLSVSSESTFSCCGRTGKDRETKDKGWRGSSKEWNAVGLFPLRSNPGLERRNPFGKTTKRADISASEQHASYTCLAEVKGYTWSSVVFNLVHFFRVKKLDKAVEII